MLYLPYTIIKYPCQVCLRRYTNTSLVNITIYEAYLQHHYKGDYIGVYHPRLVESSTESQTLSDGCVLLEYTNETVIFCMSEQDAEAAELTTLMKKGSPHDSLRSEKNVSQTADSIVSQLSDLAGDSKVRCVSLEIRIQVC